MHAGSQIVRSILSGTTTTRRPTATVQPLRDLQARPAVVQPAPTDPRLITLLEKALDHKPQHEDPRVAELMAKVEALQMSLQEATKRLADASNRVLVLEKSIDARLAAIQAQIPQEPPSVVINPPADRPRFENLVVTPNRDGAQVVRSYTISIAS